MWATKGADHPPILLTGELWRHALGRYHSEAERRGQGFFPHSTSDAGMSRAVMPSQLQSTRANSRYSVCRAVPVSLRDMPCLGDHLGKGWHKFCCSRGWDGDGNERRGTQDMPTVRVVLRNPVQGETVKIYHDVEAHISTNNVLHITRGGGDSVAEFQAEAYLYWEYEEDAAAPS